MTEYTKTQISILDTATELSQTRGFNAFSYKDVADRIGIRTASIHHHFQTKAVLGAAMTRRYREAFAAELALIPKGKLRNSLLKFSELFIEALEKDRLCLCGTLAAEYETLPDSMQSEIRVFFEESEGWLQSRFATESADPESKTPTRSKQLALVFMSALEGAMLSVRPFSDPERFRVVVSHFIDSMTTTS